MKKLKIKLMKRMLGAELTRDLGHEDGECAQSGQPKRHNGTSTKVLEGQDEELLVAIMWGQDSSFEPELMKKGQPRIDGMDNKIIGLNSAGLGVRDI
nr:transposase [Roseovarius bejariae]